jgi:hypothetical protein
MPEKQWTGPERRKDNLTLEVVTTMREWLETHKEKMLGHTQRIEDRLEQLSASTLSVVNEQNKSLREIHALFKAAFPEGDAAAHRKAHEDWIERSKAEKEFWLDIKKKVIGWGIVALLGWIGIALWAAFLRGPA